MKIQPHITILVSAVLFTVLSSTSCKEKKPEPTNDYCMMYPQQCETPMEAKQYFSFKVGSWWVYEEETTHERDSLYVTEYQNNTQSLDFSTRIFSEREQYTYHYYPLIASSQNCYPNGIQSGKCIFVRRSKGTFGDYLGEDKCFFIQHKKGDQSGTYNVLFPNDNLTISEVYYNGFELNGFNFNRTVKIHEGHTFIENNNSTYHYFAKGVGLIRKELLDSNEVWNLIDYHIQE